MARTKAQAVALVDAHVNPRDCFVTYVNNATGWAPLTGTGCAHWVAHQRNIRGGRAGDDACDLGYRIRVGDVLTGLAPVAVADVRVGDVWANAGRTHCGIVDAVTPAPGGKGQPTVTIRHDSSGQGGVRTNDWATYFGRGGVFFR